MRIILNSDVLHMKRSVASGLPNHVVTFCRDAAGAGAILVLPRTTLLEIERNQRQLFEEEVAAIDGAIDTLRRWRVDLPPIVPSGLVGSVDFLAALRAIAANVEVVDPQFEDYREAERRACLHLPPQSPGAEADEMRDLVIWAVALRLARSDGRAILVSRDEVHSHERGEAEAQAAGLLRARTLDDALVLIGSESPAGAIVRIVFNTVWNSFRAAGLPLPEEIAIRRITNIVLATDEDGRVSCMFAFRTDHPNGELSGTAKVVQIGPNQIKADLENLKINDTKWQTGELSIVVTGELPIVATPAKDRLDELRTVLEEHE